MDKNEVVEVVDRKQLNTNFQQERAAIRLQIEKAELLDTSLMETIKLLEGSMAKNRAVSSLLVRMTEQLISNRNLIASLNRDLVKLVKDMLDRNVRLLQIQKEAEAKEAALSAGASDLTSLLQDIQNRLIFKESSLITVDTPEVADELIAQILTGKAVASISSEPVEEATIIENEVSFLIADDEVHPDVDGGELCEGDVVSDTDGNLFIILKDGVEDLEQKATRLYRGSPESDVLPYALVAPGDIAVPVVEFSPA